MPIVDDNSKQVIYGVSHVDGITPVKVVFSNGKMRIDSTTSILFDPSVIPQDKEVRLAKATSSADDGVIKPWVVNATTGAVLVDL